MIPSLWTRKGVVLIAAAVMVACVAALLSINLGSPDPISSAALGANWQCSRFALVLTTCTPVRDTATASIRIRKDSVLPAAADVTPVD